MITSILSKGKTEHCSKALLGHNLEDLKSKQGIFDINNPAQRHCRKG